MVGDEHKYYINRALELAIKGRGNTSPNPLVGCVIVKNGRIIGEGFHQRFGGKHAEAEALDSVKGSAEGATLYCNLEPCCEGIPGKKTPPCTNRIIAEKVKKVVIANIDANPYVNGKGIEQLRKAGIEVITGIEEEKARGINRSYFKNVATALPYVTVKIAQTVDGRIATASGDSQWITHGKALDIVQQLRFENDGILVGAKTVLTDNPRLTQRKYPDKQPFRIVLDEKLCVDESSNLLNDDFVDKTIIVTTDNADSALTESLTKKGATILKVKSDSRGWIDLKDMLKKLYGKGIGNLLVEGGSAVFTSFIKEQLVDRIIIFAAPKFIGNGISAIGDLGTVKLERALQYRTVFIENVDGQVMWELIPESKI